METDATTVQSVEYCI